MQNHSVYIGIDNGVSGSIGIIHTDNTAPVLHQTPTIKQQSYTKKKQQISRLNHKEFSALLVNVGVDLLVQSKRLQDVLIVMERPFMNPGGLKASISAMRCLESQLIAIEDLKIPYIYIDSKEWQKELLPSGIKGTTELKNASYDVGIRLFPQCTDMIKKQKDADALLIAEWARRHNL